MLRNARNKVEFKDLATGKIIEVNPVTAEEIQRQQQALLAEGKKPLYELHESPDVKGLEPMVRRIARDEIEKAIGSAGVISADGRAVTTAVVADDSEDEDAPSLEDISNAIANINATEWNGEGEDNRFTAKGNVKKAAIEEYLGAEIDNTLYQKAIKA